MKAGPQALEAGFCTHAAAHPGRGLSHEETLAGCLGGRSAGFDFYELMPR